MTTQPLAIETWFAVLRPRHPGYTGPSKLFRQLYQREDTATDTIDGLKGEVVKVAIVDAEQLERLVDMASKMPDLIREIADRLENANEDNSIERFAATQVDETLATFAAWREGNG